ncbi:hypothetical protein BDY24DRAFT_377459 [Mrakia frigida]|uniref:uncharacterized protein n=1 Tax=Mrakia frigida TaxID=29902 RepID=UPI003FCC128B
MVCIRRRTTLFLLLPPSFLLLLFGSGSLLLPSHPILPTPLHLIPPPSSPQSPSHPAHHPHALPPLPRILDHLNLSSSNSNSNSTSPQSHNLATLTSLSQCVSSNREFCKQGQTNVILLSALDFEGAEFGGWTGGEAVWAASVLRSAKALGYSVLFTMGLRETRRFYEVLGEFVKVVIVEPPQSFECLADTKGCTRTEEDARRDAERRDDEDHLDASSSDITPFLRGGIPAWKVFAFHFWSDPQNPLGPSWTLSPEPYHLSGPSLEDATPFGSGGRAKLETLLKSWSGAFQSGWRGAVGAGKLEDRTNNFYLGYSIEDVCMKNPYLPPSERKPQAFLFAKHSWFFSNSQYAWSDDILESTVDRFNLTLLSACIHDKTTVIPKAITWLGSSLPQEEFLKTVGEGVVLVGVGDPPLSPSPYDALCLGVPFINPILSYSSDSPLDRTQWYSQQNALRFFDPPFVYNVHRSDKQGFLDAVQSAMDNPMEGRFVPEHMREEEMRERVRVLVEGGERW